MFNLLILLSALRSLLKWDKDGNATLFIWKAGEPLFPEWKTLEFLNEQRSVRTLASWQALYLQRPIVSGGGVIPINKFKQVTRFGKEDVKNSVRYWDKAATADGDGAYTAGVLMHQMMDGSWLISHIARGHWSVFEREQIIKTLAKADKSQFKSYEVLVEQEPGSGGKESAEATIRNLAGFRVSADRPTGDKKTRAEPWVAQVQAGNVSLLLGEWTQAFLDECEQWPDSKHKDQVDAAAGALLARILAQSEAGNVFWQARAAAEAELELVRGSSRIGGDSYAQGLLPSGVVDRYKALLRFRP
jgi:predicted phage terminase large subunit-like protein